MHLRICFISLYSYPLFNAANKTLFGGSELRAWILGSEIAGKDDFDVSFVVYDHGQNDIEDYFGIKVYKDPRFKYYDSSVFGKYFEKKKSFPYVNVKGNKVKAFSTLAFLIWKKALTSLSEKVKHFSCGNFYGKINADIYIVMGVSNFSAKVLMECHEAGKKVVLMAGSDSDFSGESNNYYGNCSNGIYAIQNADAILVQTATQAKILKEKFGRDSVVLKNPFDFSRMKYPEISYPERKTILWVGKSDKVKQPHLFISLARAFPNCKFKMIMNRSDASIYESIVSGCPSNVEIIERVPYDEIEKYFAEAMVFVSTSLFEGFPNVFLQAAKYKVPLLSLNVNPEGFITEYECGIFAESDSNKLFAGLQQITTDIKKAVYFSENVYLYGMKEHSSEIIRDRFERILMEIAR